MASIKLKLRESSKSHTEGTIYYQIIHNRIVRQIKTPFKIFITEWNKTRSSIIIPKETNPRKQYLETIQSDINLNLSRLALIVSSLDSLTSYTVDDIVAEFTKNQSVPTLFTFMNAAIVRLKELKRYRTSETYTTALIRFKRFRKGSDLLLSDISSDIIMSYEVYLRDSGITNNTISFYMRILRAVYNQAVDEGVVNQTFPFKKVYTGIDKTVKRALPIKIIKKIKDLDLSNSPKMMLARDMFMFSFYTRGMSFVDMAYLRKKDIRGGVITYRRRKTGRLLHIKMEKNIQEILDRNLSLNTDYLLPIINRADKSDRDQYKRALAIVNSQLKQIAERLSISNSLTMYVARYHNKIIITTFDVNTHIISVVA